MNVVHTHILLGKKSECIAIAFQKDKSKNNLSTQYRLSFVFRMRMQYKINSLNIYWWICQFVGNKRNKFVKYDCFHIGPRHTQNACGRSGGRAELNKGKLSRHLVFIGIRCKYSIKMLNTLNETIFHVVTITTFKQKMHKEDSLPIKEIYSFSHKAE